MLVVLCSTSLQVLAVAVISNLSPRMFNLQSSPSSLLLSVQFDADQRMSKTITFSSVTKSMNCQVAIEGSLDKRGRKTFGPPNGMKMTVFLDDLSMPEINEWGDQPTLEIVRQIMEFNGFAFLDKDKRGAIKLIEDVQYCAAMSTPGGGKNEIPQRLKRHFGIITMVSVLMFTGCWLLVTGYCSLVTVHCSLFTVLRPMNLPDLRYMIHKN